mmetsp:Transcript_1371/g.3741  ORF Transcript_1371/g.3741 Transcript_1371/m.3741 type:complete len:200 (-) Transcript_1371:894-1493(-)
MVRIMSSWRRCAMVVMGVMGTLQNTDSMKFCSSGCWKVDTGAGRSAGASGPMPQWWRTGGRMGWRALRSSAAAAAAGSGATSGATAAAVPLPLPLLSAATMDAGAGRVWGGWWPSAAALLAAEQAAASSALMVAGCRRPNTERMSARVASMSRSRSPTTYSVALAGKYQRDQYALTASCGHALTWSILPMGNLHPRLFS